MVEGYRYPANMNQTMKSCRLWRGDVDTACFILTHAFVFALEAGTPEARALNMRPTERGRAHVLTF